MHQNFVKVIGINDESRENAYLSYVDEVDGLKDILNRDFDEWSNFDRCENIGFQQWIFARALDIYRGKKIDIKCDCCEYVDFSSIDFKAIEKERCFGKKSAYMIEEVVNEILIAKKRRESDGTYSA